MLANLLPGVRELRAPLAAGLLWLAAIWLLATGIDRNVLPTNLIGDANRATGFTSDFGRGVAVSFGAYLVGSLSEESTSGLGRRSGAIAANVAIGVFEWAETSSTICATA